MLKHKQTVIKRLHEELEKELNNPCLPDTLYLDTLDIEMCIDYKYDYMESRAVLKIYVNRELLLIKVFSDFNANMLVNKTLRNSIVNAHLEYKNKITQVIHDYYDLKESKPDLSVVAWVFKECELTESIINDEHFSMGLRNCFLNGEEYELLEFGEKFLENYDKLNLVVAQYVPLNNLINKIERIQVTGWKSDSHKHNMIVEAMNALWRARLVLTVLINF